MADVNHQPTLRPSADEISAYFHGLHGSPQLVARSNVVSAPFVIFPPGQTRPKKCLFNVGSHPIVGIYDRVFYHYSGLRNLILLILQSAPWVSIDVVRIGINHSAKDNPVVLLVTMKPGTIGMLSTAKDFSYTAAIEMVQLCRRVFLDHGLDVHIEMKEGRPISTSLSPILPADPYERISRVGQSFGSSVEFEENSLSACSLGLYVTAWIRTGPRTFATTSARAAVSQRCPLYHEIPLDLHDLIEYSLTIQQPAYLDHMNLVECRQERFKRSRDIAEQMTDLSVLQQLGSQIDDSNPPDHPGLVRAAPKLLALLQEDGARLRSAVLFSRRFGRIAYEPRGGHSNTHGTMRDWVLVSLNVERFGSNPSPKNILPPFVTLSAEQVTLMDRKLLPGNKLRPLLGLRGRNSLIIGGTVPNPTISNSIIKDTDGHPTLRLMKYGRTTHWTAGVSNEIFSDIRHHDSGLVTKEWCILNLPDPAGVSHPFAEKGDEGAPVVDYRGRLAGVVCPPVGLGIPTASYITPIAWLVEDISRTVKCRITIN